MATSDTYVAAAVQPSICLVQLSRLGDSAWPTPCPNLLTQDNVIRPDCAQTLCTKDNPLFMAFSATASFSGTRRCAALLPCAPVHTCCSHRNAESQQAQDRRERQQEECSPFVSCGDVQLKVNVLHIHMHRDEVSCSRWAMAMPG